MMRGWTWTNGPRPCERRWHYFVGEESVCGLRVIDGLQPHKLEAAPNRKQMVCAGCGPLEPHLGRGLLQRPEDVWPKIWLRLPEITGYLQEHHASTPNKQLALKLNCGLTNLRNRVYALGLLRMEMEYWPEEAVADLQKLYPTMGDFEMAKLFNERYPKKKGWTKKHIAKKRLYLQLDRTPEMLARIHADYHGRPVAEYAHAFHSVAAVGEVRIFKGSDKKPRAFIKTKEGPWRPWAPFVWRQHNGPAPKGYRVYHKDGDPSNCAIENLGVVKHGDQHKVVCSGSRELTDKYVAAVLIGTRHQLSREEHKAAKKIILQQPALLEVKRNQMRLTRAIKSATSNG